MADIAFSCPNCGQHLEAPDDMQGEQTTCPSCEKALTVPRRTPARPRSAVVRPGPTAKPKTRKRSLLYIVSAVVAVVVIAGLTDGGRAVNDPRVSPAPVSEVSVETGHPVLFSGEQAPAVARSTRVVARASNDPRGPLASSDEPIAEAAQG